MDGRQTLPDGRTPDGAATSPQAPHPQSPQPETAELRLLRRYEPVLLFTAGELFLPMAVEQYLAGCGLWQLADRDATADGTGATRRLAAPGELTPDRLAELGTGAGPVAQSLRYVERPLRRAEHRAWHRDPQRVRFRVGSSRFAAVGLLGRLIDAGLRVSLLVRGRVPGGTTAAAELAYRAVADPRHCPYYGRVTYDRGYVVLQYWYCYAMNDWRSTFGGVNDHEADWEQVTLFLPDPPDTSARPAWVAFSSHDEVGDDLRRRQDDPDIRWQGTHPVVFVGAGSHSGAYLPGDYVVSVEPPALRRLLAALRRVNRRLLPWTRDRSGTAFGIPFVDYRRGDGLRVGPGGDREWTPVLVDDTTPWVRDYRGLWGLDTGDPLGGERAPAGPRYERSGAVRLSWADPVGWAGLDKEPPGEQAVQVALDARLAELAGQLDQLGRDIAERGDELRRARVGVRALSATGAGDEAPLAALESGVAELRSRRRTLRAEREAVAAARDRGLTAENPHAHLRHRAMPNVDPARSRQRVLRAWSSVSASVLLVGLAAIVSGRAGALIPTLAAFALVTVSVEAFARGYLAQFVASVLVTAGGVGVAWVATQAAVGNWRVAVAVLLVVAAGFLLLTNVRDFFLRR